MVRPEEITDLFCPDLVVGKDILLNLDQPYVRDDKLKVRDLIAAKVGKLGENIAVRRWDRLKVDGPGKVHSYVHMGGKIAVLLAARSGNDAAVKNAAFERFVDDSAGVP